MKPHVVPGLGKARLAALRWLAEKGTVSMFGRGDPPFSTIKWLRRAGYVESVDRAGEKFGPFRLTAFSVSEAGRRILAGAPSNGETR